MDDVRGDLLEPSNSTTPAAVIANENIKVRSFESNDTTHSKRECGPYCGTSDHESSSVTLNELAMNTRRLYCNFVDLSQGFQYQ